MTQATKFLKDEIYRGSFVVVFENVRKIEDDLIQVGNRLKSFKRVYFATTSILINTEFIEGYYQSDALHNFFLKDTRCEIRRFEKNGQVEKVDAVRFIFENNGEDDSSFGLKIKDRISSIFYRDEEELIFP